ncbi:MAG: hypothetical protein ACRENK_16985 [Gemmatimonadaceae bacterium]
MLVQDGRNLRGRLQLTFRNGIYQLYEETSAPREKIIETLRDHGCVRDRSELCKLAGIRKAVGLKVINELVVEKAITEKGRELRAAPEPALTTVGSRSSAKFPEGGTGIKRVREPASGSGSRFGNPLLAEMGTAPNQEEVII